jgi:uncharacterized membrane protein HdeD (DUF308 family)
MKFLMNILSVILVLLGIVWLLQGINILPGSFMSGHIEYAVLGVIVGAVGVILFVYNNRRRKAAAEDQSRLDH